MFNKELLTLEHSEASPSFFHTLHMMLYMYNIIQENYAKPAFLSLFLTYISSSTQCAYTNFSGDLDIDQQNLSILIDMKIFCQITLKVAYNIDFHNTHKI